MEQLNTTPFHHHHVCAMARRLFDGFAAYVQLIQPMSEPCVTNHFQAKYFLQYFQYSLDMPLLDSIHIPIFKNRYHIRIYIYIYWSNLTHIVPIYIEPGYAAQGAHVYVDLFFLFSKYYWLSDLFLFQVMKYFLFTWSSFVWWHVISSVPSQMLMIKTLSSLFDVLCQSELRHSEKCCECVKMVFVGTDMS